MSNETPTFLEGKANYFTEFGGIDNNIIFSDDDEIRGLYLWKVFDRMMQDNPRQRAFVLDMTGYLSAKIQDVYAPKTNVEMILLKRPFSPDFLNTLKETMAITPITVLRIDPASLNQRRFADQLLLESRMALFEHSAGTSCATFVDNLDAFSSELCKSILENFQLPERKPWFLGASDIYHLFAKSPHPLSSRRNYSLAFTSTSLSRENYELLFGKKAIYLWENAQNGLRAGEFLLLRPMKVFNQLVYPDIIKYRL